MYTMSKTKVVYYECPFNWQMEEMLKNYKQRKVNTDKYDELNGLELKTLIYALVELCQYVVQKNVTAAKHLLAKIEDIGTNQDEIIKVLEEDNISPSVVKHIVLSTIYYTLKNLKEASKADQIEKLINNFTLSKLEKTTLEGCKGLAWSYFYLDCAEKSLTFFEKIISSHTECSLWWYMYSVCLKRLRITKHNTIPYEDERRYLHKAYMKNKNPYYGCELANCYKEKNEYKNAVETFYEIKDMKNLNYNIYCALALGFIYYNKLEDAKTCLDKAEGYGNNKSMYYHYQALYYKKKAHADINDAILSLHKIKNKGNYKADLLYVECLHMSNSEENIICFLKCMLLNYKSEYQKIEILLHIAMYYYKNKYDYNNALLHFHEATLINIKHSLFKNYYYIFGKRIKTNIFNLIKTEFIPNVDKHLLTSSARAVYIYFENLRL